MTSTTFVSTTTPPSGLSILLLLFLRSLGINFAIVVERPPFSMVETKWPLSRGLIGECKV